MKAHRFALAAALFGLIICVAEKCYAASFMGLGIPGGPGTSSFPIDISANGRVIVGAATTGVDIGAGFRWTRQRGIRLLSEPADDTPTPAAVSGNGRLIIGNYPSGLPIAHRWTPLGGWQALGDLPGGDHVSSAIDVSGNGHIVVGASRVEPRNEWTSGWQAFIWTPRLGMRGLGYVNPDDAESAALGVSRGGNYIVGTYTTANSNTYSFRWTKRTGMQSLLGTDFNSQATEISNDGSVVAGTTLGVDQQAYRWTESGGVERLGYLSVSRFNPSSATSDMTTDGSVIVGYSHDGDPDHPYESFIWDGDRGMRSVRDALVHEYGLGEAMQGWTILQGVSIAANGQFLTGAGRNPQGDWEGWRADLRANVIPEPGTMVLSVIAVAMLLALSRRHARPT